MFFLLDFQQMECGKVLYLIYTQGIMGAWSDEGSMNLAELPVTSSVPLDKLFNLLSLGFLSD